MLQRGVAKWDWDFLRTLVEQNVIRRRPFSFGPISERGLLLPNQRALSSSAQPCHLSVSVTSADPRDSIPLRTLSDLHTSSKRT